MPGSPAFVAVQRWAESSPFQREEGAARLSRSTPPRSGLSGARGRRLPSARRQPRSGSSQRQPRGAPPTPSIAVIHRARARARGAAADRRRRRGRGAPRRCRPPGTTEPKRGVQDAGVKSADAGPARIATRAARGRPPRPLAAASEHAPQPCSFTPREARERADGRRRGCCGSYGAACPAWTKDARRRAQAQLREEQDQRRSPAARSPRMVRRDEQLRRNRAGRLAATGSTPPAHERAGPWAEEERRRRVGRQR